MIECIIGRSLYKGDDYIFCWRCGSAIQGESFQRFDYMEYSGGRGEYPSQLTVDAKKKGIETIRGEKVKTYRNYCADCYAIAQEEYSQDIKEYERLKSKLMVERAIRSIEKQGIALYDYREAIKVVTDFATASPEKFESSHEIIAAIILIANEVQTKVQARVDKYRVDFLLPDMKVALEIDGYMHNGRKEHDNNRDIALRNALGDDWEIVRIKTEHLDSKADLLVEAIVSARSKKQETRKRNGGLLPEQYKEYRTAQVRKH